MLTRQLSPEAELRPLEPWQAVEFADHVERVREHLRPWVPFATRIVDADTAREMLQRFADDQARDSRRIYGIWVDGELSGGTMFVAFDTRMGGCELGVWIEPSAQGRGLITRAARAMIDWAVEARGMSRIEWRTDPKNTRSRAVAQRLGMTLEGVLRSNFPVDGARADTEVWSMLADEWRQLRPTDPAGG